VAAPAHTTYDEMPYINRAFPQTHPDRLATLAKLFGVETADIETCRVLELGCASGDNLIPMALGLPNASFLGIDFSRRQIDEGQATVNALGLANIELRRADIADADAAWGRFDYIVCHGIYSWVPEPVRDKVLAICNENLAPHGVAFVSYNTYPGWHMRDMIRNMMLYHSAPVQGAQAKVQQSRALLDFLAQSVPVDTPYSQVLKQEVDLVGQEQDAYLFHDHLEENNAPVYFHQFAAAAQRHGLQYLAEADFSSMLLSNFPPHVAETLRRIGPDIVRLEQYMDFVRSRMFRQTLLVHQGVPIERKLRAQVLAGFHLASLAQPVNGLVALAQDVNATFRAPQGATLTTGSAVTKAAMLLLAERWPLAFPFAELAAAARARLHEATGAAAEAATAARDEAQLANEMMQCYGVGLIELRMRDPILCLAPSARPVASPLARLQVERERPLTNLRHEPVVLDETNRQVLRLLDGTRDRDTLVAAMVRMARDGVLHVEHEGRLLTEGPVLEGILRDGLEESLPKFARAGLIVR
jgi:methyltransferase-like protein/2-polyprenyl-3-methyl-5-hydroxy-6-metoxy-1,4-benzoquinol methylase